MNITYFYYEKFCHFNGNCYVKPLHLHLSPTKHFAILMESNLSQQAHSNVLKLLSRIVFPTAALSFLSQAEMQKTIKEETGPKFLGFFEKRLCENGGGDGYYVGNEVHLSFF